MGKYTIITNDHAKKFIENLDRTRRARIDRLYDLFEDYGRLLPTKYLKKIENELWELRAGDIRLFLTIKMNSGYVVHAIYKKTQKLPKKDIKLALKRIKEF